MMDLLLLATHPVRFRVILIYCLDCNKQAIYLKYVSFALDKESVTRTHTNEIS
jgi:hypothetical protein